MPINANAMSLKSRRTVSPSKRDGSAYSGMSVGANLLDANGKWSGLGGTGLAPAHADPANKSASAKHKWIPSTSSIGNLGGAAAPGILPPGGSSAAAHTGKITRPLILQA